MPNFHCRQNTREADGSDFDKRITKWIQSRPKKPECQLDSKNKVLRDFGYGA